jgi:transcriptional regulator with XRE-family HTH domain
MNFVDWVNFGRQVKAARSMLGLTKDALARAARIAPATLTRIEDGASDLGSPNAGAALQSYLERSGIEFPHGSLRASIEFHRGPLENVAVTIDASMPTGTRFMWGKSSVGI